MQDTGIGTTAVGPVLLEQNFSWTQTFGGQTEYVFRETSNLLVLLQENCDPEENSKVKKK